MDGDKFKERNEHVYQRAMKRLVFLACRHVSSVRGVQRTALISLPLSFRRFSTEFSVPSSFAPDPPPLKLAKQFSYQVSTSPLSKEDIDYYIRACESHQASFTPQAVCMFLGQFSRVKLTQPGIIDLLNTVMSIVCTLQEHNQFNDTRIVEIMVLFENILLNEKTSHEVNCRLCLPSLKRLSEFISLSPPITNMQRLSMCYYTLKHLPDESASTHLLLRLLNQSLIESSENLNGRSLARMFRGVSEISSTRGEVKQFCNIISAKLSAKPPDEIANITISNIFSSMRNMQSADIEVRRLLRVIISLMRPFHGSFNGNMLASMMTGLRLMDTSHSEVRLIVRELLENFREAKSPIYMGPANISAAVYGMQRMKPLRLVVELLDIIAGHMRNIKSTSVNMGHIGAILFGLRFFGSNHASVDVMLRSAAEALSVNTSQPPISRISTLFESLNNKSDASEATCLLLHQFNRLLEKNTYALASEDVRKIFGGISSMNENSPTLMDTLRILCKQIRTMPPCLDLYVGLFKLQMLDASQDPVRELATEIVKKLPPLDCRFTNPLVALVGFLQEVDLEKYPDHIHHIELVAEFVEKQYIPHVLENINEVNTEHFWDVKVAVEMLALFNKTIPEMYLECLNKIEKRMHDISTTIGPKAPFVPTLRKLRMRPDIERWLHEQGFHDIMFNTVLYGRDVDVCFTDPRDNSMHAIMIRGDIYNMLAMKSFIRNRNDKFMSTKYGVKVHTLHVSPHTLNTPYITEPIRMALKALKITAEK